MDSRTRERKRYTNLRLVQIIDCESLLLQLKLLRGCSISLLDIFMKGWINLRRERSRIDVTKGKKDTSFRKN